MHNLHSVHISYKKVRKTGIGVYHFLFLLKCLVLEIFASDFYGSDCSENLFIDWNVGTVHVNVTCCLSLQRH